MDNLDIYIYTAVVFIAFIAFTILTFKELGDMDERLEKSNNKKDTGNK